jgi:hypothetical protein
MDKGARLALVHVMPESYFHPVPNSKDAELCAQVLEQLGEIRTLLSDQAPAVEISTAILHGEPAAETTELFHGSSCSVIAAPPPAISEQLDLRLKVKGTAVTKDVRQFAPVLNAFNERNNGRRVALEEDDRTFGAQLQVEGYVLRGVTYDEGDSRIDIMLGPSATGVVHLTRTIPAVTSVAIAADEQGKDVALQIRHGKAQTLVLLRDSKLRS